MAKTEPAPPRLVEVENLTEEDRKKAIAFLVSEERAARSAGWSHYADMLKGLKDYVERSTPTISGE